MADLSASNDPRVKNTLAEQMRRGLLSRRALLGASITTAVAAALAACGQSAAPSSPIVVNQPPSAPPKPSGPPSGAASGKPSAAASAAARPAGSGSPAASPAASAKPSAQANTGVVKLAWVSLAGNQLPWPLAKEAGYFDKYGVNVDLSYVQGSAIVGPALLANEVNLAWTGGQVVVPARAVKQDMIMVAGFQPYAKWMIMVKPEIKAIEDLKGKTVAVGKIGQADYFGWVYFAEKQGWKAEDLKYANGNDEPGKQALLASGTALGVVASPPADIVAQRAGAHLLWDSEPEKIPLQQVGIVGTGAWLAQNRAAATSIIKATIEAVHRWKTDPAYARGLFGKYLKEDDPAVIESGYSYLARILPDTPYPSKEGFAEQIREVSSVTPEAKNVTPDECFDNSYVKELEDSGFIKQVFA
jgi:NitT/TauT family transport system substrate-binding protein